jgi:hypothetical protein
VVDPDKLSFLCSSTVFGAFAGFGLLLAVLGALDIVGVVLGKAAHRIDNFSASVP